MDDTASQKRPRRRARPLGRDLIAAEAMALVDAEGLEALSFRALARRLGCEAMSLYHYFPSKAHLVDALVDICISQTPLPPEDLPFREQIRRLCLAYRDTALRHPAFTTVFTTHRLNHRAGLAWLEGIARIYAGTGLPPERQAVLFRVLSYFLTGAVIDEALGYARGPSAAEPAPREEAAAAFPAIMALGGYFGVEHHLSMFEAGLDLILDWYDAEIARHGGGGGAAGG